MAATLLFVHGTGTREVSTTLGDIRERLGRIAGWQPEHVVAVEWGKAVGPKPVPIAAALPPPESTRGEGDDATTFAETAALWDLLAADPMAELRLIGAAPPAATGILDPTAEPVAVAVSGRVDGLAPPAALKEAGIDSAAFVSARDAVGKNTVLNDAAAAAGDADDEELVTAVARALVATMLANADGAESPRAAYDATARDALVDTLADALAPTGTRGLGKKLGGLLLPLAMKVAVAKRNDFMVPLTEFVRDVAYYVRHGHEVRDYIANAVRQHAGDKVVLLAHSLGGIACVDLLADRANAPKVDLLVTCGSQAPLLYYMDALHTMRPSDPVNAVPFTPWVNVYNREDLLSFCTERVFVNTPGIEDYEINAGVPFPASHSAYWTQDLVYELIRDRLA